jgi:hypothetical protein
MSAFFWVIAAVLSRIVPHPWLNFTAVGAGLLYFGAKRSLGWIFVPVLALAATDYYLTVFTYNYAFHVDAYLVTWAWYAAVVVLGYILLRKKITVARVGTGAVLAPTSFFLLSNYAVWVGSPMYPHTFAGLMTCYAAGLPFYRNDLISTAVFCALAFGLPVLARRMAEARHAGQQTAI